MVEVTIDVDPAMRQELFDWIQKIPLTKDLAPRLADDTITATLQSPPQLGTLAMAVATFLRTKPSAQRPTVTATASNGESLDLTSAPNPHDIRRVYIAMDKQPPLPPPVTPPVGDIIDAEIVEDPPAAGDGRPSALRDRPDQHQRALEMRGVSQVPVPAVPLSRREVGAQFLLEPGVHAAVDETPRRIGLAGRRIQ